MRATHQIPLAGGGHHHHGGGRGWGPPPGWWQAPYYDRPVDLFVVDDRPNSPCPDTRQPVRGADGLVYRNACLARMAGTKVAGPAPMGAWSASIQSDGEISADARRGFWAGVAAGALGVLLARAILR